MPEEDEPPHVLPDDATELMTPPTGGGSILPQAPAPLSEVIGDYEVLEKLGAGGMGAVYRARQRSLDRMVALKVLPAHLITDAESVSRFQREARVAASLSHANLVRVYDAGEAGGCHFIAMELIEGEDLGRRLKRQGRLPAGEALRLGIEVARGLEYAWSRAQLIHRDIKPANIFLAEGAVKVGDLGLAKSLESHTTGLTQTGTMMGTPHYLSPEQARAERGLDFRADIYSLGCTLYHMLTGQVPYAGTDAVTIIHQHIHAPLPAIMKVWPQCPVPLARLVARMVKKSKHERPASYAELIGQMESVWAQIDPLSYNPAAFAPPPRPAASDLTPTPTPASSLAHPPAPVPPKKSKLPLYSALAVAVIAFLIGGVFFIFSKKEPPPLTGAQIRLQQREAEEAAAQQAEASRAARLAMAESMAIKLWDTPDKRPKDPKYIWENGILRISQKSHLEGPRVSPDVIMRASLRYPLDQGPVAIKVRAASSVGGSYLLALKPDNRSVVLFVEKKDDWRVIERWDLPRIYQPGEWLRLQLRAEADTLTASLDGQILGTARDTSIIEAGKVGLFAGGDGYFRDIEYVPLDGVAAPASAAPAAEPWQDLLRDPALLTLSANVERTTEGLRFTGDGSAAPKHLSGKTPRDGAIRVRAIFGGLRPTLHVRDNRLGIYILTAGIENEVRLSRHDYVGQKATPLQSFPLRQKLRRGEEYEMELRVVGQLLTVKFNGEVLGTLADDTHAQGRYSLRVLGGEGAPTLIKALAFLDLDTPGGAAGVGTPAAATKEAPFVNSLGMKFVPVPITGGPTDGKRVLFSIWETRVQDYTPFYKENPGTWGQPGFEQGIDHPAVMVTWLDAHAFCGWVTAREQQAGRLSKEWRYRLPSDHEWSCAVGIGDREDPAQPPGGKDGKVAGLFPWGLAWPPPPHSGNYWSEEFRPYDRDSKTQLNGYTDGYARTAPVGSYPANPLGLHDLGGNAWEWCNDRMDPGQEPRVMRGGAWNSVAPSYLLASERLPHAPHDRFMGYGFRVVLAPGP